MNFLTQTERWYLALTAYFLSFMRVYPETFADIQKCLDQLELPVRIRLGKEGSFEQQQKEKLGSFVPITFDDNESNVWMHLDSLNSMSEALLELVKPTVADRTLVITFEYHSQWRPACASLAICAALMSDYDSLTYNDFMSYGFISKEETVAGVYEYLQKFKGVDD